MSEEENPNDSNAMMNLNINQAKEANNQIEINSQTNSENSNNGNLLISLNNSENKRESYLTDRKSNISSSKSKKSNNSYYDENKIDENNFNYYKSDTQVTSNINQKSNNNKNNKDINKSNDIKENIETTQPIENNYAPYPEDTIVKDNSHQVNEIKYIDNVRDNNPSYNQTIVNILNQNNYNEKPVKRNRIKIKKRKKRKISSCEKCLNSRFCAVCCGNRGFLGLYCCICVCFWVGIGIAIAVKH